MIVDQINLQTICVNNGQSLSVCVGQYESRFHDEFYPQIFRDVDQVNSALLSVAKAKRTQDIGVKRAIAEHMRAPGRVCFAAKLPGAFHFWGWVVARFTGGWVSIERRLLDSDIGTDAHLFCIWSTLIAWANIKESTAKFSGKPIRLKAGELVTSHDELATHWRFSHSVVKRCLNYLKMSQRIDLRSSNQGTHIRVLNYSKYQDGDRSRRQRSIRESANDEPTVDQRSTNGRPHREQENKETPKQGGGTKAPPTNLDLIWNSYSEGFKMFHGFSPNRTTKTDGHLAQLAKLCGEDAPQIVNTYARFNKEWWVKRLHDLRYCIEDIDQVRAIHLNSQKVNEPFEDEGFRMLGVSDV